MEVWTWVVAYIVGFALLQLLAYRYVRDSDPSVGGPGVGDERAAGADRDGAPAADDAGIYCRNCSTHNERVSTYRYCKGCLTPLG